MVTLRFMKYVNKHFSSKPGRCQKALKTLEPLRWIKGRSDVSKVRMWRYRRKSCQNQTQCEHGWLESKCSLIYIFLSSGYSDTSKLSSSSLFLGTISVWIFLKYVYVLNIPSYSLDILTSKVLLSILLPGASRQAKWSPYPLPDVLGWASADVGIFFLFFQF